MSLYLLPFPAFDPVLISFGPVAIRWYALAYIVGILLGWLYARAIIRREQLWGSPVPMTVTDYDDFVLWVTLGIILGGRFGYVLFYNPTYFAAHPLEAFQLCSRQEGIIPALESSHAIAETLKRATKLGKDKLIICNLSGRGDKDVSSVAQLIKL